MPRVSEAHLAARRRQIMEAAARCFIRSGFHNTSMQDVITEAGLSVGAFYRYFKSKDDLVRAIAGTVVTEVTTDVDRIVLADPVPTISEAIEGILTIVDRQTGPDGLLRLAVQVWGEATHNDELREYVGEMYGRVRGRFVTLASRARDAGHLPAHTDPEKAGAVLFGMVPGYVLQRVLIGIERNDYVEGLAAVLAAAPKTATSTA